MLENILFSYFWLRNCKLFNTIALLRWKYEAGISDDEISFCSTWNKKSNSQISRYKVNNNITTMFAFVQRITNLILLIF